MRNPEDRADMKDRPIGMFDSGVGGLTVARSVIDRLPGEHIIYLGDDARGPYGPRDIDQVRRFAREIMDYLLGFDVKLVIIACNTASARALRTIQQKDLPGIDTNRRVLGVIRPTAETVGSVTKTKHVGILGTMGTVTSQSYLLEIQKLFPDLTVVQEACPLWVPLVENNELDCPGTDYFVKKNISRLLSVDPEIDSIILGCTHYPLLMDVISKFTPPNMKIIPQDRIVADSLIDYLGRHPEIDGRCSRNGTIRFYTTDSTVLFDEVGSIFFRKPVRSEKINL